MTIKIEFPADDKRAAEAFGNALLKIAGVQQVDPLETYQKKSTPSAQVEIDVSDRTDVTGGIDPAEVFGDGWVENDNDVYVQQIGRFSRSEATDATEEVPETDADGFPWDKRIHANTKATNNDGTWKKRRKPSDLEKDNWEQFVKGVELELRQTMNATPPAPAPAPETVDTPTPPAPVPVETAPTPEVQVETAEAPTTFPALMQWIIQNKLQERAQQVIADMGLPNFPALNQRPDMIPTVYEALKNG